MKRILWLIMIAVIVTNGLVARGGGHGGGRGGHGGGNRGGHGNHGGNRGGHGNHGNYNRGGYGYRGGYGWGLAPAVVGAGLIGAAAASSQPSTVYVNQPEPYPVYPNNNVPHNVPVEGN